MYKVEFDVTNISEADSESIETIILGAVTGLSKFSGVVITVTDGDEVVVADSPGK